ncbi:GTP-binding protein Obg/CgtA [Piedraia hortae CBS 480.64]|uniref:GTP-binding protein Obg/CgtA n=1 Tax=Piedraia hortae CBS 480.64 TaxID=1314780 RepID=A0A6A7C9T5_9PEZI|nr:GTP-binding protein Obg/CgtA [Piedraia hortae CBS 480.64]
MSNRLLSAGSRRTFLRGLRALPQTPKPCSSSSAPTPEDDYRLTPFIDSCTLKVTAGAGGHGCISFFRDKFVADGPANGGDGGTGGNVYIQAVRGETSLHKLARKQAVAAARGKSGRGRLMGGERGEDVLLTVPVGTVVRELERRDPVAELRDKRKDKEYRGQERWILFNGPLPRGFTTADLKRPPPPRRSPLAAMQPTSPVRLDLSEHMDRPVLLVAGAMGGLGNVHFATKDHPKPKWATKGEGPTQVLLHLELKILADVGLVGLPNAGKSTLLRALTKSRTRVGDWPFTTLAPSMGTIVLDGHVGPMVAERENIRIADIPGIIKDAHLDRGLGLGFLRHVERASVLSFVIDLSDGDAVETLKALWSELRYYQEGITMKPWFVVATKADLPDTRGNFEKLRGYIEAVQADDEIHPSGVDDGWRRKLYAIPVSGLKKEGVNGIAQVMMELLCGK